MAKIQVGLQLYSAINDEESFLPEVIRLLDEVVHPEIQQHFDTLVNWAEQRFNQEWWETHQHQLRRMNGWYVNASLRAIDTFGVDSIVDYPSIRIAYDNAQRWMHVIPHCRAITTVMY